MNEVKIESRVDKLYAKYRKLLAKLPELDTETMYDISAQLNIEPSFIEFVERTYDWTNKEHDGLLAASLLKKVDGYYVDKYDNKISYNGIKGLKRAGTELPKNEIHDIEKAKCAKSFKYFRKYYCFITTKTGLSRPEPRSYQEELENELLSLEDLIILYPRQSGKTVTVSTYLLWVSIFHNGAINIGIVANKGSTAREVLDKIKKIFLALPLWMMLGIESWNKGSIEYDTGTRIMTDSPSSDSFRGYTINILYEDESAYIAGNLYEEYVDSVYPTMNSLIFKQVINSSTPKGMNHFFSLVEGAKNKNFDEPTETIMSGEDELDIGGYHIKYTVEDLYNQMYPETVS